WRDSSSSAVIDGVPGMQRAILEAAHRKRNTMDIGVEISLYPLQADFASVIHQFLDRLNGDGRFRVVSNSMSTQVFGPCDEVLDLVRRELRTTFEGLEAA